MIGTGGETARLLYSAGGDQWTEFEQSIKGGKASQGIFSVAANDSLIVLVGGDYASDTIIYPSCVIPGADGFYRTGAYLPYQSSVVFANDSTLISIGTPGGYVSRDMATSWHRFTTDGMHTLVASESGDVVYTAGAKGRIGKIVFNKAQLTD